MCEKITNPHITKSSTAFFGRDTGKAIADYLCVYDETVDDSKNIAIFDPAANLEDEGGIQLSPQKSSRYLIFKDGQLVYE